jgi:hypothetical protein
MSLASRYIITAFACAAGLRHRGGHKDVIAATRPADIPMRLLVAERVAQDLERLDPRVQGFWAVTSLILWDVAHPEGRVATAWKTFMLVVLGSLIVFVPFLVAFKIDFEQNSAAFGCLSGLDAAFVADIYMTSRYDCNCVPRLGRRQPEHPFNPFSLMYMTM